MFRDIKRLMGSLDNNRFPMIDNCFDDAECAEALAQHFANIHNNSAAACSIGTSCDANDFVDTLLIENSRPFFQFSESAPSDKSGELIDPQYQQFISIETTRELIKSRKNLVFWPQ